MNILKSIGAVLAGFMGILFLSIATDAAAERLGIFPPSTEADAYATWMLVLALMYRSIYTVAGGYLTAWLAPKAPMGHVVALMVMGGATGIAGAYAGWHLGAHWYPVLLAVTGPFLIWLGGRARMRAPSAQ